MPLVFFSLIVLLILATVMDIRERRIPNWLCGLILAGGIISNSILVSPSGFYDSLAGFLTSFSIFLLLYRIIGLGAGDVKLMGAIGATVGFLPSLAIIYHGFLLSGLFALGFVGLRWVQGGGCRNLRAESERPESPSAVKGLAHYPFPMAPGITVATAFVLMPELLSFFGEFIAGR